jgi:hypothetical protein
MGGALVVVAVGQLMLWGIGTGSGAGRFVPGLLLAGVASGVLNAALGRESVTSVLATQAGLGIGANNTARYLGSALGVTVVSVVAAPSGPVTAGALVVLLLGERARVATAPEIRSTHEVDAA